MCAILISLFISLPNQGQENNSTSVSEIKRSLLWPKLFKLIKKKDWDRVHTINKIVENSIAQKCSYQGSQFLLYRKNISNKNVNLSQENLAVLIANNIVFELLRINSIKSKNVRKTKIKTLFTELISIQFQLQDTDFNYYKSLYSLLKALYNKSDDVKKMNQLMFKNTYCKSIKINCP